MKMIETIIIIGLLLFLAGAIGFWIVSTPLKGMPTSSIDGGQPADKSTST
jgi:hypothetical protein